jgi:hypothetical protein
VSPTCELIGALPVEGSRSAVLLGVACGATLSGACSLVLNGSGLRLRIDLSTEETAALAGVLLGITSAVHLNDGDGRPVVGPQIFAARNGAQVVLVVGQVRLRVAGRDITRAFFKALHRHVSQPARHGCCS